MVKPKLWTAGYINLCIANFLMACSFNLLMPSIPLYITEVLGVPQTQTGIVLASYAIAILLIRPFSGYIVDMYSRKKVLLVSLIAFVLIFFGYFNATAVVMYKFIGMMGISWSFYATALAIFIVVRFLHGLAWGISAVSTSTLSIDLVPSERRAEGIGYTGTFMNVAMAIAPFVAIEIYQTVGFDTLLCCAILMGGIGILAASFIKSSGRSTPQKKEKLSLDRFFLTRAFPIFLNQLLPCFAWGSLVPFVAQYGKQTGVPNVGVFFLFCASGIILSRIFSGKLVDRGHIHGVNAIAMFTIACAFIPFAFVHSLFSFCASGLFIGIGFGMMLPALQTLYINMAENNQRGTANSTYLIGFDVGLASGDACRRIYLREFFFPISILIVFYIMFLQPYSLLDYI